MRKKKIYGPCFTGRPRSGRRSGSSRLGGCRVDVDVAKAVVVDPACHFRWFLQLDVTPVEVSHLYFFEGTTDAQHGDHGTVKYGHGHGDDFVYTDLTIGDVSHSYKTLSSDTAQDVILDAGVSEITGGTTFELPTGEAGDIIKVINASTAKITVGGFDIYGETVSSLTRGSTGWLPSA